LRTGAGTWYNLVLINDDQVLSNLKQEYTINTRHTNLRRSATSGYVLIAGPCLGVCTGSALKCSEPSIMRPITHIALTGLFASTRIGMQEAYTLLVKSSCRQKNEM
jgi:hypothetical protein